MKQFLFLLLIAALFLPARESQAQTPKNQTPVHYQELTKSGNSKKTSVKKPGN